MSMTSEPPPVPQAPPAKSRRRWRIALAFAAVFVAVPLAYCAYLSWSTGRDLEDAIAETDRLDPRWRLEDLQANRKPVPDDRNAMLVIVKCNPAMRRQGMLLKEAEERLMEDMPQPT